MPKPMRFCGAGCYDSWVSDGEHGVIRFTYTFADAGCCSYCGAYVPTNAEKRTERMTNV